MGEVVDYASNAKGNTGVALGATGLGLAVANMVPGLFGGLFGRGPDPQYVSNLQAENSMLKSENYSDKVAKETYSQSLKDLGSLRSEMFANVNPLIQEAHANAINVARMEEKIKCLNEKNELRSQILDQKIDSQVNLLTGKLNEAAIALNGKIDTNNAQVNGRFQSLDQTIACIAGKVNDITTTSVKFCKISPMPVPAAGSVPAAGTTWYPGCTNPLAPEKAST